MVSGASPLAGRQGRLRTGRGLIPRRLPHVASLAGTAHAARPRWRFTFSKQPSKGFVNRAIIRERLSDFRVEDDNVRCFGHSLSVFHLPLACSHWARAETPNVMNRSSSNEWSGSAPVTDRVSRKAVAASSNETLCLAGSSPPWQDPIRNAIATPYVCQRSGGRGLHS